MTMTDTQNCKVTLDGLARIPADAVIMGTKTFKTRFIKRFDTNVANSFAQEAGVYDDTIAPEETVGCFRENSCFNTGIRTATAVDVSITYARTLKLDATKVNALTYYVTLPQAGVYPIETYMFNYGDTSFATGNGNGYITSITAATAGDYLVTVDLAQIGFLVNAGWTPSTQGVEFVSVITPTVAGQVYGWSTIRPREDIRDLICETTAIAQCVKSFELTNELEMTDSVCRGSVPTKRSGDFSFEAVNIEGDFRLLQPGVVKKSGSMLTMETLSDVTLESVTINGNEYASLDLSDFIGDQCSSLEVILNVCKNGSKGIRMKKMCIPDFSQATLPNDVYVVLSTVNGVDKEGVIIFDKSRIGKQVCISYPVESAGEKYCFTDTFNEQSRTKIQFVRKTANGMAKVTEINNAVITTIGSSESSDDSEAPFTVSGVANLDDEGARWCETIYNI